MLRQQELALLEWIRRIKGFVGGSVSLEVALRFQKVIPRPLSLSVNEGVLISVTFAKTLKVILPFPSH